MNIKNILAKRMAPGAMAVILLLSSLMMPVFAQETAPPPQPVQSASQQPQSQSASQHTASAEQAPQSAVSQPQSDSAVQEPISIPPADSDASALTKLAAAELTDLIIANGLKVQMKVNGAEYVPGTPLARDSILNLALSYELDNDAKRQIDSATVVSYTLPKELQFSDIPQKDIEDATGTVIGHYHVTGNVLQFSYTDSFITSSNIKGFFKMDAKLTEVVVSGGDETSFTFAGSNTPIIITFEDSIIKGKKEFKLNDDGTITFTIALTVDAPSKNVSLTDTLGQNFRYRANTLRVTAPDGNAITVEDPTFAAVEGTSGTQAVIALGDLTAGVYTLVYDVDVVDGKTDNIANVNHVEWKWTARTEHTDKTDCTVTGFGLRLQKDGSLNTNQKQVNWIVTVNGNLPYADMSNQKLYDMLSDNQAYASDISIYRDQNSGTPFAVIKASDLQQETVDGVVKTLLYTFPEDAGSHRFYIRYTTNMTKTPNTGERITYTNTVETNGKTATKSLDWNIGAVVGPAGRFDKRKATPNTGTDAYDKWDSEIRIDTNMPEGMVFTDWLVPNMSQSLDGKNESVRIWTRLLPYTLVVTYQPKGSSDKQVLVQDVDYTAPVYRYLDATDKNRFCGTKNPFGEDTFTFTFLKSFEAGSVFITYDTKTDWSSLPPQSKVNIKNFGCVDVKNLNGTTSNWSDWEDYNAFSAIEKSGSQAVWDATANGGQGGYIISWNITANALLSQNRLGIKDIGDRTLTVEDQLPAGLLYVPGSAQVTPHNANNRNPNNAYTGYSKEPTVTGGSEGSTLMWEFPNSKKQWYEISFKTTIDSNMLSGLLGEKPQNGQEILFRNTAIMRVGEWDLGKATGDGSYVHTLLQKAAKQVDGKSRAEYSISVNTPCVSLNGGNPLTLEDIIPDNCTLMMNTVAVYQENTNKPLADVQISYDGSARKLSVKIPDATWCTIKYTLMFDADDSQSNITINNKATLNGVYVTEAETKDEFKLFEDTAGAKGESGTYTLKKMDSDDITHALKGAEFTLYRVNLDVSTPDSIQAEKIEAQTTGTDGMAVFKKDGKELLRFDELYYYVETKAPNGYVKDETPQYFMLEGNSYAGSLKKAEQLVGTGKVEKHTGMPTLVTNKKISTENVILGGTKALTNGTVQAGDFTFALYSVDNAGNRKQLQTVQNGAAQANGEASFTFAPITYTKAGVYRYIIAEVADPAQTNIIFDKTQYSVSVTVEEEKDANGGLTGLNAVVEYPTTIAFSNTKAASVPIEGMKVLTGKSLAAGDYTFVMKDVVGNKIQVVNGKPDSQGKASFRFDTPLLTKAGTYLYKIYEEPGAVDGITYDKTVYMVTVTVDDGMNATTTVVKQGETAPVQMPLVFTNSYSAQARIEGVKLLSGAPIGAGDYSFALYAADENGNVTGDPLGVTNCAADGSFAFTSNNTNGAMGYREAGSYYYAVREVVPEDAEKLPGVSYDTQNHFVTVLVTLENGALQTAVKYPANGLTVKNVYSTTAQIKGEKVMSDESVPAAGVYEFALYAVTDAGETAAEPIATVTNTADGSFVFASNEALTYSTSGVWHYKVREVLPKDAEGNTITQQNGVIYDETVYDIAVTVAKDETGRLTAKVDKTQQELRFTNIVNAQAEITGTKTMNGGVPNPGAFTFELKNEAGDIIGTATNDAEGSFVFTNESTNGALSYAAAGKYSYTVTEKNDGIPGVVYDDSVHTIVVTVKQDNQTGGLTATVDKSAKDVLFKNTGVVSAGLRGTKRFLNGNLTDGRFTFELYEAKDETGALVTPDATPLQTVSNQGAAFAFEPIKYTVAGDYYYVIQEQDGGLTKGNVYYDNSVYVAKVSVSEEKDGTFTPVVSYYLQGSEASLETAPEFVNSNIQSYRARRAAPSIAGKKLMAGETNVNMPAGAFRFELYEGDKLVATATNTPNGGFSFPLGSKAPGTYEYTVKEQNGGQTIDGIVYDSTVHQVTVIIDAAYNPTILVNGAEGFLRFTNTAQTYVTVNKTWDDADNAAGERPESVQVTLMADGEDSDTQTLSADTGWSYTWSNLPIRGETGNKIVYTVREDEVPNYTPSMTAVQETNGVKYELVNSAAEITSVFIDPIITKKLNGAALQEAQFEFGLYDSTDALISTATNQADGSVVFPSLSFALPGTYRYSIREIPGSDTHVEYSTTAVGAIVTVARDEQSDGSLSATVAYQQDGVATDTPTITNLYSAIVLQVQKTSKDSSHSPLMGAVYGLYRVNESGTRDILVGTCESDANGMMRFMEIEAGQKYYFKEISAPEGHTVDAYASEVFWITQDSATGVVTILAKDASGNWVPTDAYTVAGNMPVIPDAPASAAKQDEDSAPVEQAPTQQAEQIETATAPLAASIKHEVTAGASGIYATKPQKEQGTDVLKIEELKSEVAPLSAAPIADVSAVIDDPVVVDVPTVTDESAVAGYISTADNSAATPQENSGVQPVATNAPEGGIVITAKGVSDATTELIVEKLNTNTREYVADAKLQIMEKSTGKIVYEWVTGNAAQAMKRVLNVNTVYILREVSAPSGYEKAADSEFTMDEFGNLTLISGANAEWVGDKRLNLYNTPITQTVVNRVYNNIVTQTNRIVNSPKTGDGAPIVSVLVFVVFALLGILYLEHRRYVRNTRK